MSVTELQRLLEPLQRSSDPRSRRQLAFSVAAELARQMRGQLTYANPSGPGADFTVFLPVADGQLEGRVFATGPVSAVPRVLVVADSPPSADLLDAWLAVEGYEVVVAGTVAEAMELATDLRPSAIVIDAELQGAQGWAALAALKSNRATAAVPALVYVMRGHRAYDLRCVDYLLAPTDRERLVELAVHVSSEPGRILVVDDDKAAVRLATKALEEVGWQVEVMSQLEPALSAVRGDDPPTCLLCNLSMRGMVGLEVAIQARDDRDARHVPVIAVLHAPTEDERWALTRRLRSAKGRSLDRTLRNVRRWIDRWVHLSQGGDPDTLEPHEETGVHEMESTQ